MEPALTSTYALHAGSTPLLVSVPHAGTVLPEALKSRLVPRAWEVENTDWHLDTVYAFAREMGAGLLVPRHSRFLVDLNRPPENTPMYPGSNNTELCPTRFFTGDPIYREGQTPDAAEVAERVERYWRPYHDALRAELNRLRDAHGYAVLWDGHSIESSLPWLFEGRLPDLNLGTVGGTSCASSMREVLMRRLATQTDFTHVTDGRFKGGYITRHYGRPAEGIHVVQMEKCFSTYMVHERAPWPLDDAKVRTRLQPLLRGLLQDLLDWRP